MNTRLCIRRGGLAFTLIELIIVIAIIAILMALLLTAMSNSKQQAYRTKALTAMKGIVSSCTSYASEYGKFPPVPGASNAGGGTNQETLLSFGDTQRGKCRVNNNELFDVLRAIDRGANARHVLNQRQQRYIETNKATDPKTPRDGFADGKDFADSIQGQYFDPWGTQYCVVLDGDGNGFIQMSEFFSDETDKMQSSAVAFSLGQNLEIGGKGYQGKLKKPNSSEAPDDVVTW